VLGHNDRLEHKLKEQGGKRAWATVLESEKEWSSSGGLNQSPGQAGSFTTRQKLTLRVEPADEPSFEAKVKQIFNDSHGMSIPQEGSSVSVIYDPDDHSKLALDMEGSPVRPGRDRGAAVSHRERVLAQYQDLEAAAGRGSPAVAAPAPVAAPADVVADQLTKLADLRDRGILSDPQFEQQKSRLLGEG
jgi:Short C-terminal domain